MCRDWQRLLLGCIYTTAKFRRRVRSAVFSGLARRSRIVFTLDMSEAAVIDVCLDDDFNIFALGVLGGRPHVMACSLFSQGKKRWMHRFASEMTALEPAKLTCVAAGQALVALGSKVKRLKLFYALVGPLAFAFSRFPSLLSPRTFILSLSL